MCKVPRCNVQLLNRGDNEVEEESNSEENEVFEGEVAKVRFEGDDDEIEEQDVIERRKTRSMTEVEKRELERDQISMFWLRVENKECYDNIAVYAVEVPVAEHKKAEVMEAKEKELDNLMKYGVYEEVENEGQERITSRWVITKKEKADGQKTEYKGRLVARGFQEQLAPQSDSPTMLKESMKLFFCSGSELEVKT